MVSTLGEILPFAARRYGDRAALAVGSDQLTYRQLDAASNAFANGLVGAGVMLKPGATASGKELADHCRQHLAAYKIPGGVQFVESVPITSSGKIMRRLLSAIDNGRIVLEETAVTRARRRFALLATPRRAGEVAEPRPARAEDEGEHEDAGE